MEHIIPERLTGEGFYLRRWQVEDAAWYVSARDEEIYQWTTEKRDLTVAETEEAIRQVNAGADALCFAIVDPSSGDLLGNLALTFEKSNPKSAEIMYWLAPAGRGRGIATRAVVLVCEWAFGSLGLERISLKTRRGNVKSQKVAERAGFRPVAEVDGEYVWYEMGGEEIE